MRRACTLIEFFIAIIVIALLASITFSLLTNIRRSAARINCQNNLKQIALSALNYQDSNGHFPPATMPNPAVAPDERFSFLLAMLPYTESQVVFARLDTSARWDSPKNAEVMANWLGKLYQCPEWMGRYGQSSGAFGKTGHLSVTNYIGVAGVGSDAATRSLDAPGIGLFGYDRLLKVEHVKDGLANTLMLIETGSEVGPWLRGGPSTVRGIDPTANPLFGDGAPFGGTHFRDKMFFRGTKSDGFHVVLGDGSVRYVKNGVSPDVLTALATIAGGEEITADW